MEARADEDVVAERLRAIEADARLDDAPEGAVVVDRGFRPECRDPGFDNDPPEAWRQYRLDSVDESIFDFYHDGLTENGWRLMRDYRDKPSPTSGVWREYAKAYDGWDAELWISLLDDDEGRPGYLLAATYTRPIVCPLPSHTGDPAS